MNTTNFPSGIQYNFLINTPNTTTEQQLKEKMKEINQTELLMNPRKRVHLTDQLANEFKTPLPREPKLFHFHPGNNNNQSTNINSFKSTPHLASSILLDSTNHNINQGQVK